MEYKIQNELCDILNQDRISQLFCFVSEQMCEDGAVQELISNDYFAVELVIQGSGIHCIDKEVYPCKENDVYIISPNTPHKYFLTEQSECLIVRRVIFKLEDWLKGDAVIAMGLLMMGHLLHTLCLIQGREKE